MIIDTLIILLFGFPGAILSLLVSAIGIIKDKYWLPLIGALLFMPFTYYLNGSSALGGIVMLLPLFQIGSAAAVFRKKRTLAWLLLMPAFFTVIWLLVVIVLYQIS